jgi:hypothetical protein
MTAYPFLYGSVGLVVQAGGLIYFVAECPTCSGVGLFEQPLGYRSLRDGLACPEYVADCGHYSRLREQSPLLFQDLDAPRPLAPPRPLASASSATIPAERSEQLERIASVRCEALDRWGEKRRRRSP